MSLPEFTTTKSPTRDEAINQIIASIAMEELGLSHIINAEGEKLQYVLGTIPGVSGPSATIEDVLKVNESVRMVLQSTAESQSVLRNKLQNALSSAVVTGPTGPSGPTGKSGAGAILSFAPGDTPLGLTTNATGGPAVAGLVGAGTSSTGATLAGETIDLTGTPKIAANFAYVVPRDGAITDLEAYFYLNENVQLTDADGTVTAQVYRSENPEGHVFTRIAGVTLEPGLDGGTQYPAGTILYGSSEIPKDIDVKAGSRLLLAFRAHAEGVKPQITVAGFGSAGIAIS